MILLPGADDISAFCGSTLLLVIIGLVLMAVPYFAKF